MPRPLSVKYVTDDVAPRVGLRESKFGVWQWESAVRSYAILLTPNCHTPYLDSLSLTQEAPDKSKTPRDPYRRASVTG